MPVASLMRRVMPDARASATNGSTKCAYVSGMTPSSEPGKRLAVFTGMTGCSAHQNDSNPRSSAALAIAPGSTQYAGSGTDTPTFIASASPDVAGDVDDTLELAPLLVLRQGVPVMRARKPALR